MARKMGLFFWCLPLIGMWFGACERPTHPNAGLNDFAKAFLDENAIRVFNSEINRTRVHFFPLSRTLVYSFWKPEKMEGNGELFLHVYPKDSNTLPTNRKSHGFANVSIRGDHMFTNDSVHFFLIKKIRFGHPIRKVVTGQYIGKGKTWKGHLADTILLNDPMGHSVPKVEGVDSIPNIGFARELVQGNLQRTLGAPNKEVELYQGQGGAVSYLVFPAFAAGEPPLEIPIKYRTKQTGENGIEKTLASKILSLDNNETTFCVYAIENLDNLLELQIEIGNKSVSLHPTP